MYVASYVTYIPTITSSKTTTQRDESATTKKAPSFSLEQKQQNIPQQTEEKVLPQKQTYLPNYNFLRQQTSYKDLDTFGKVKNYKDAKTAYSENSRMYSLAQKPKSVVGGTKVDLQLPQEAITAKENLSKKDMVNTYLENERYYQITAA